MSDRVRAKVVARNALSSQPVTVQVLEGARVRERFRMTEEQAAVSDHGPYSLDDKLFVVVEGIECRVLGRVPQPTLQSDLRDPDNGL
jgi:hypothetical protein